MHCWNAKFAAGTAATGSADQSTKHRVFMGSSAVALILRVKPIIAKHLITFRVAVMSLLNVLSAVMELSKLNLRNATMATTSTETVARPLAYSRMDSDAKFQWED